MFWDVMGIYNRQNSYKMTWKSMPACGSSMTHGLVMAQCSFTGWYNGNLMGGMKLSFPFYNNIYIYPYYALMQWHHRIFKKARRMRLFWAFGLSLKEHCFHQFESNLKNRYYEYALDFCGYFIYSCVSMFSFFIFISYLFCKKTVLLFLEKQWLFIRTYIFLLLFFSIFVIFCVLFLISAEIP
jgi:hypothetical protein